VNIETIFVARCLQSGDLTIVVVLVVDCVKMYSTDWHGIFTILYLSHSSFFGPTMNLIAIGDLFKKAKN